MGYQIDELLESSIVGVVKRFIICDLHSTSKICNLQIHALRIVSVTQQCYGWFICYSENMLTVADVHSLII